MKKIKWYPIISVILVFSLAVVMCSCSNSVEEDNIAVVSTAESLEEPEESEQSEKYESSFEEISVIAKLDELPDYISDNSEHYTKLLSNILKLYYTGVINGRIHSGNFVPQRAKDVLPSENDTAEKRKEYADYCTIGGALEFYSTDSTDFNYYEIYNGCLPYFSNDKNGNIYITENISMDSVWQLTDYDETMRYVFKYCNPDKLEKEAMAFISSEINSTCKNYYNGIKEGTIVKNSFAQQYTHDTLPDQYTAPEPRLGLAKHATIGGALEFIGKYRQFSIFINKLGIDSTGNIYPMSDKSKNDLKVISDTYLTMQEIYHITALQ